MRQVRLVEHLGGAGHAKVEDLARLLGVTPQTIRGDLRQLDEQGVVSRVRGGAMLRSRPMPKAGSAKQRPRSYPMAFHSSSISAPPWKRLPASLSSDSG
ncbi:MAG: DeoR family transcriptional regulator [Novosphingobium sp.]